MMNEYVVNCPKEKIPQKTCITKSLLSRSRTRPRPQTRPCVTFTSSTSSILRRPRSKSVTNGISTVEMQLSNIGLLPSAQLLSYYQQKIKLFNKENSEMQEKVDNCISVCDIGHHLEQELAQRNEEISSLQQIVRDMQVHLYQERKQSLKLYVENNLLKTREFEDRRRIELLLKFSDVTKTDLDILLSTSQSDTCIHKRLQVPPRLQTLNRRLAAGSKAKARSKNVKPTSQSLNIPNDLCEESLSRVLTSEAHMAKIELEEQQIYLAEDFIQTLLKDRELTRKEHQAEQDRLQAHISSLISRLKLTQDKLCVATQDRLKIQQDYRSDEIKWVWQKEQMEQKLKLCKEHLGGSLPNLFGHAVSGTGTSKKLRSQKKNDLSLLKEELEDKESLVTLYRNQSVLLEGEMERLKVQSEACKSRFKERTKQMSDQLLYLKTKYNELNQRRILDAEGFHNDMKLLRNRLQGVEKHFHKINFRRPAKVSSTSENNSTQIETATRDTILKAKQLKQELKFIKNKIIEIESDLKK